MTNDKKPSIYSDRTTIGSPDDLDEYGVWVKSEPQDLSSFNDADTGIPEIEDLPSFDTEDESDSDVFDFGDLTGAADSSDTFADFQDTEEPADEEDSGFKDVPLGDFIGGEVRESTKVAPDLSTQLLKKIADELSSIRTELKNLKIEFSGLKAAAATEESDESGFFNEEDDEKISLTGDELNNILNTADFTEEAGAGVTEESNDSISFEDDLVSEESGSDDETLSISDLDMDINLDEPILDELGGESSLDQSAMVDEPLDIEAAEQNFEEVDISLDDTGSPELKQEVTVEEEETFPDFDSEQSFADLGTEDAFPDLEPEEEIPSLDEDESFPDFETEESEELKTIREMGVEPMTAAPTPEDADYLSQDPLSEDSIDSGEFAEETMDLSEAVIDEPDLSAEIHENPLEEPSLEEISISLDMDDDDLTIDIDSANQPPVAAEEELMDLSIDVPEEPAEEDIPLALDVDTIDSGELDEDGGDLSLIPEGFIVEADDSQPTPEESEEEALTVEDLDILGSEESITPIEELAEEEISEPGERSELPSDLKQELKTVLSYMDQLLDALPDDKIEEFAQSEYYDTYKKLFKELGIV